MRRKKPRVVWLPADINNRLGEAPLAATNDHQSSTIIHIFTGNPLGDPPVTEEIPIVKDFFGQATGMLTNVDSSLADIEQTGYRLRRIVGKLSFSVQQGAAQVAADPTLFHITAGFIIRRTQDDGTSFASLSTNGSDIRVSSLDAQMDPWIWRRSWNLTDKGQLGAPTDINSLSFPSSNDQYGGGNLDGPHVDAKTARVVGPEERLFLSVTVEGVNGSSQAAPGAILLIGDLRVLGSMKTSTGNRRNASR